MTHRLFAHAWVRALAIIGLSCAPLVAVCGLAKAEGPPGPMRVISTPGKIVPIPASVPHEEGDMVDSRIVPDLVWIAKRYPIYVTDGYSGPLPNGEHVGCNRCHVKGSDHYNGLAVDVVPVGGGTKCDATWAPITRLADWAEPVQNQPRAPFRWVGYEGDAGHGCGNHLHLSWNHAPAPEYHLAEWVEVFPVGTSGVNPRKRGKNATTPKAKAKVPSGPSGGVSQVTTGGLSANGSGD